MKTAMSGLLAALLAAAVPALAQQAHRENGVNQRQQNQQQRIQQGSRQGDLTRGETRQLQHQARDIRREEHAFRSDGRFTPAERRHVQRDLDRVSRDINRERHDGDRRGFGNDGRFQNGHGYAYGHDRQNNWRNRYQVRGWDPSIDRREDRQHDRIVQGIRSGELTQREAQRLIAEQRMIRQEERLYKSDGIVTPWERRDLQRDLDVASQHIYNETHDAQTRR